MIKKLQQLKAKKGFTLVELIVVIAIIGVLAAILVPTMMGFVTNSRVTSANSTAASFEDQIENILTEFDTAGYGMKLSNTSVAVFTATVTNDAGTTTWDLTMSNATGDDASFKSKSNMPWAAEASATSADEKIDADSALKLMGISLCNLFPDVKSGYVSAWIRGGNVEYVYYTPDQESAVDSMEAAYGEDDAMTLAGDNINFATKVCTWDQKTAGIASEGVVVGTAPALALGNLDNAAAEEGE